MYKLLQINTVCNTGSTGKIAENIGLVAMQNGYESHIAYGRGDGKSRSKTFKISSSLDLRIDAFIARILDNDGFCRKRNTKKLIRYIEQIKPDIVHLHNLHGYYLNVDVLLGFLALKDIPVVWTLHDCWAFTGHCPYFYYQECDKWQKECCKCVLKKEYPKSWFIDNSRNNYKKKKSLVQRLEKINIVVPSQWLFEQLKSSFLSDIPTQVINNGIDITTFRSVNSVEANNIRDKYNLVKKKIILGVANDWIKKGLEFFVELSYMLSEDECIVLVGLNKRQIKNIPNSIVAIQRTNNIEELASFYSVADVFVNPTLEDNFPTTNIEALACGTPVVTFRTGGSPEAIGESHIYGEITENNDIISLRSSISVVLKNGKECYKDKCAKRALEMYNSQKKFNEYIDIYNNMLIQGKREGY